MKRLFVNFMTFAAMATALTFTACSSDSDGDDNGKNQSSLRQIPPARYPDIGVA